jgi:predicted double-glycine peptidase
MYYSISIALLLAIVSSVQIKTITISPIRGEFDNATVFKDSNNYKLESKTKSVTVLNVPDVYQATDYTCGPSSLTAVLSYYAKQDYR